MNELKLAFDEWKNFVSAREEARREAEGASSNAEIKAEIAQIRQEIANLQATLARKKADLFMNKSSSYSKPAFDAEWSDKKKVLRAKLIELLTEQLVAGKTGYELGQALGTKSMNMIYEAKRNMDEFKAEQEEKLDEYDWHWHRFTGTRRYALSTEPGTEGKDWKYVLMKGAIGTEQEGLWCIFDFETGVLLQGNNDVYHSDAARMTRAATLAELLAGTYSGKLKLSKTNDYFETTEEGEQ